MNKNGLKNKEAPPKASPLDSQLIREKENVVDQCTLLMLDSGHCQNQLRMTVNMTYSR